MRWLIDHADDEEDERDLEGGVDQMLRSGRPP